MAAHVHTVWHKNMIREYGGLNHSIPSQILVRFVEKEATESVIVLVHMNSKL